MEQKEFNNTELRSERVRKIIDKTPPHLVYMGTTIITIITVILAMAIYRIPYPITIEADAEIVEENKAQILVPYKFLYLFNEQRTAYITIEGYENESYLCKITHHDDKLFHMDNGNYFIATAVVYTTGRNANLLQKHMKAEATIVISNKTLWQHVTG